VREFKEEKNRKMYQEMCTLEDIGSMSKAKIINDFLLWNICKDVYMIDTITGGKAK